MVTVNPDIFLYSVTSYQVIFQMWASYYNIINQAFPVPDHLVYTQFSLTYGPDVGQAVVSGM